MGYEIEWTPKALESFEDNIEYLRNKWTVQEISNFVFKVEAKVKLLSLQPKLGSPRSKLHANIRHTLIHKRVSLIYRIQPSANTIELLLFWNNYKHPSKLKID